MSDTFLDTVPLKEAKDLQTLGKLKVKREKEFQYNQLRGQVKGEAKFLAEWTKCMNDIRAMASDKGEHETWCDFSVENYQQVARRELENEGYYCMGYPAHQQVYVRWSNN